MTEPGIIEAEPTRRCMACGGGPTETRPYGPGGREICFNCFARMPEWEQEAKARFKAHLDGEPFTLEADSCGACSKAEIGRDVAGVREPEAHATGGDVEVAKGPEAV